MREGRAFAAPRACTRSPSLPALGSPPQLPCKEKPSPSSWAAPSCLGREAEGAPSGSLCTQAAPALPFTVCSLPCLAWPCSVLPCLALLCPALPFPVLASRGTRGTIASSLPPKAGRQEQAGPRWSCSSAYVPAHPGLPSETGVSGIVSRPCPADPTSPQLCPVHAAAPVTVSVAGTSLLLTECHPG